MTDRAWMPFFVADHVADTLDLSALEHGAYMLLILHYWRRGPLPVSESELRKITRLTRAQWCKTRSNILQFFTQDGEAYRHKRLDAEIEAADAKIAAKTQRAQAAAAARWHAPSNASALAQPGVLHTEPESQPEPEKENSILSDKSDDAVPKPKSARKNYPESYEAFWRDYPADPIMSKSRTFEKWQKLSPADQTAAHAALPAFKGYCLRNPTYRPVHAERFLSQRRFDGFAAFALPANADAMFGDYWNGEAERLVDVIGAAEFQAWFAECDFLPGPPKRLLLSSAFRRDHVREKYAGTLERLYGEIRLECRP